MSHKDDILNFLKQNPNEWFSPKQLTKNTNASPENVAKYTKQLVKWNDSVERKEIKNPGVGNKYNVLYRYKTEG